MKNQEQIKLKYALINLLRMKNPQTEIKTRLEILGHRFEDESTFRGFMKKRIKIKKQPTMKVAFINHGKPDEMVLGWWAC